MKKLWQETMALFVRHFDLCVPYVISQLLICGIGYVQRRAANRIVDWYLTEQTARSILADVSVWLQPDGSALAGAARMATALRWVSYFADACMDAASIVLTALLVGLLLKNFVPNVADATKSLRPYANRILLYALKYWGLSLALTLLITFPENYLLGEMSPSPGGTFTIATAANLLILLISAWVMAPLALGLLRPVKTGPGKPEPISAENKRLARFSFMIAVTVSLALSLFLNAEIIGLPLSANVRRPMLESDQVITHFPYALLYVAFALLAERAVRDAKTRARLEAEAQADARAGAAVSEVPSPANLS
jgi:hypothetical protein